MTKCVKAINDFTIMQPVKPAKDNAYTISLYHTINNLI